MKSYLEQLEDHKKSYTEGKLKPYNEQLREAKASGRPYRTRIEPWGHLIIYMTDEEIAECNKPCHGYKNRAEWAKAEVDKINLREKAEKEAKEYLLKWVASQPDAPESVKNL